MAFDIYLHHDEDVQVRSYSNEDVQVRSYSNETLPCLSVVVHGSEFTVCPRTHKAGEVLERGLRDYCDALAKARLAYQLEESVKEKS